jgi:hypothetical protein
VKNVATQFPAFCTSCGLVFQSKLIAIFGTAHLNMANNRETCPRCGAPAELPDGTFEVVDDTIRVLKATDLTRDRLARLTRIAEQASEGIVSFEAAAEEIVRAAPELGALVQRYAPTMRRAFFRFLCTVLTILASQGLAELRDHSATPVQVRQAVERAVHECQAEQRPAPR